MADRAGTAERLLNELKTATTPSTQLLAIRKTTRAWWDGSVATDSLLPTGDTNVLIDAIKTWEDPKAKNKCIKLIGFIVLGTKDSAAKAFADAGALEVLLEVLSAHDPTKGNTAVPWALSWMFSYSMAQRMRDVPGVMETLEEAVLRDKNSGAKHVLGQLRELQPSGRLTKSARAD